jgi:hypothetical protein
MSVSLGEPEWVPRGPRGVKSRSAELR